MACCCDSFQHFFGIRLPLTAPQILTCWSPDPDLIAEMVIILPDPIPSLTPNGTEIPKHFCSATKCHKPVFEFLQKLPWLGEGLDTGVLTLATCMVAVSLLPDG